MAIFEKISGLGQETAKKTKAMSESVRLAGAIKDEEKKQQDLCRQLGEYYYQTCKDQAEGPLKDLCSQIEASKVLVTQCKEQLNLVKGTRNCPNCQSEAPTTSAFCSTCGTSLPPLAKPQVELLIQDEATCSGCGAALEPDAAFCVSCGAKVTTQIPKPVESEPKPVVDAELPVEQGSNPPAEADAKPPTESEAKHPTGSEAFAIPPTAIKSKFCTGCGATLEDGVVFCVNCGQKVEGVSASSAHQVKEEAKEPSADNSKETPADNSKEAPAVNSCKQCGNALIPGNLFCVSCGKKVESQEKVESKPIPPVGEASKPSCVDCGKELKPESMFCTNCGKKVK